jgi:plastocyanin
MRTLLALSLVTIALAGCTGGGDDGFVMPPMDDEGRYVIEMRTTNRFVPDKAEVPAGATVVWLNQGGIHTVTADDGSWDSGDLDPDDTYERTFTEEGTVAYHCHPHRNVGMVGIVRVVAPDVME